MPVTRITPRMQAALSSGAEPLFFADLWLSALNAAVDTQADFEASAASTNMDFTTEPGVARLAAATAADTITQTSHNSNLSHTYVVGSWMYVWQKFTLPYARKMTSLTIRVDATGSGGAADLYVAIVSDLAHWTSSGYPFHGQTYKTHATLTFPVAQDYVGDVTVTQDVPLPADDYWLMITPRYTGPIALRYQNTDAYSGGELSYKELYYSYFGSYPGALVTLAGDLYFSMDLYAYESSGSFTTAVLDLGEAPPDTGVFQLASSVPDGCILRVDLSGSASADMSSPTLYEDAQDGDELAAFRFWQAEASYWTDASRGFSPAIDMLEILFPGKRVLLRENRPLRHARPELLQDFQPLLEPPTFQISELKVLERVASGGGMSLTISDTQPDTIHRIVSNGPLKNYRVSVYLGADVPGFTRTDLCRFFIGIIEDGEYKPRYRKDKYTLDLKCRNPLLELKRKAPVPSAAGLVTLGDISINEDGTHAAQTMINLLRNYASIPGRYIDIDSFIHAITNSGDADMAASSFIIRRSNAAGLADTRVQSPEEVNKLLAPLAEILDGYIVEDESSRISLVLHDPAAAAEAIWADEDMVKAGEVDAIGIQGVDSIKLGYSDFLFNVCICGCGWDGSTGDWTGFSKVYAAADSDSADDFAMGLATFIEIMEKPMREVSKWLGPEANYGGETLAQHIAQRNVDRFAYPPVRMTGVQVPLSQFLRTVGSVVQVHSREFVKYRRDGIAVSETKKFMVMKKTFNRSKNIMVFDLLELQ